MKRINRQKLINLRNNIQTYLEKVEREDKVLNLDKTIIKETTEVVNGLYDSISRKLDDVKQTPSLETDRLVEAIESLKTSFVVPQGSNGTEEIVKAISNIRFPEVNFPNTISVDNFPPQKIPNPVTNMKATIVADDTDLLQGIIDAINNLSLSTAGDVIQIFGENTIAAGNTIVMATYTVPALKVLTISGVYAEGIDDGLFNLYVDSVKVWQGRNSWTERGIQGYLQYLATAGQVVELKITNLRNASRAYSGGFYGRQLDA